MPSGTLYVVATPIGNLEDITLRALSVLRAVSVVACEDTRRTRTLLDRHAIAASLVPHHKFNESRTASALVARMREGENVALVSDGGTPAVSDPGYRLVREALDAGITVTPIPGPSAFVAAVSASGLPSDQVTFHGFLPHRAGERRRAIASIEEEPATHVFYESPRRAAAALRDLAEILGPRRAAVARELTKAFESWYRGTLPRVAEQVAAAPAKGEFCIVIEGAPSGSRRPGSVASRGSIAAAGTTRPQTSGGQSPSGADHGVAARPRIEAEDPVGVPEPDGSPAKGGSVGVHDRLHTLYQQALAAGADKREALKTAARACGLKRAEAYRLLHER